MHFIFYIQAKIRKKIIFKQKSLKSTTPLNVKHTHTHTIFNNYFIILTYGE